MLKLLNPNISPVGGYRFIDPDTGFKYNRRYSTFDELERHVAEYRNQNRLEQISNFFDVWQNWVCQEPHMEKKCCPLQGNVRRSFSQYYHGGKTWIKAKFTKAVERFVKQSVAEARAAVCANCRSNVQNTGHTMAQFYTDKFMRSQVGSRKTSQDAKLFTCRVCTCLIRSKVHYSSKHVSESLSKTEIARLTIEPRAIDGKPLRCWQVEAIEKVKTGEDQNEIEEESKKEK